jgi:hypothetical protein
MNTTRKRDAKAAYEKSVTKLSGEDIRDSRWMKSLMRMVQLLE